MELMKERWNATNMTTTIEVTTGRGRGCGRSLTPRILTLTSRGRARATGHGVTVMICMDDQFAFGAYQALQERGLRIPDDISVASFDDDEIASYLRPPLTTARIPYEQMGREAVRMLLGSDDPPGGNRVVPVPLQVRGSVRGLPR